MSTVDFFVTLKYRAATAAPPHAPWVNLGASEHVDAPSRRDEFNQREHIVTRGLTPAAFAAMRAALFGDGARAAASHAALPDRALVAVLLAAAGATLDRGSGGSWKRHAGSVFLGHALSGSDIRDARKAALARGVPRDSPAFPRSTNWMEHAARAAVGVAEPFDALFQPPPKRRSDDGSDDGSGDDGSGDGGGDDGGRYRYHNVPVTRKEKIQQHAAFIGHMCADKTKEEVLATATAFFESLEASRAAEEVAAFDAPDACRCCAACEAAAPAAPADEMDDEDGSGGDDGAS
jgi:hypothetical protein